VTFAAPVIANSAANANNDLSDTTGAPTEQVIGTLVATYIDT
jgi:ABC-type Fe2+-enterobactin transport system substrate-binding protein